MRETSGLRSRDRRIVRRHREVPEAEIPALTTPADVIKEKILRERKITQEQLADSLNVSRLTVNQLVNGKRSVTAEMAIKLAEFTKTSPKFWLNLQMAIDLARAEEKLKQSA